MANVVIRSAALAASLLGASVVSAATGFASGDAHFSVTLLADPQNGIDAEYWLPAFSMSYWNSVGDVHEDGFETGYVDFDMSVASFDLYAYAFSPPFGAASASRTHGLAQYAPGVLARFTNSSGADAEVDAQLLVDLSLDLDGGGPNGGGHGAIGYGLTGHGTNGLFFSHGFGEALAVGAEQSDSIRHQDQTAIRFLLAPGESATFSLTSGYARFAIFTAVPEPASWAMMIAGFGLVGGLARRRQPCSSSAARRMAASTRG